MLKTKYQMVEATTSYVHTWNCCDV